jgi:arabinose-5-phosphate isomerase
MRSWFVPPINALHGDIGIVCEGDVFVFLSKSGESEELLNLIPYVRNKGAYLISWVSSLGSRLEKACDLSMHLTLERELCPFDLAPTTSDAIQLLFGNVLAVALMQLRNFTLQEYAKNHPAGRIGKRITMRVRDLMLRDQALPLCHPDELLMNLLVQLSDKRCGCLLVVDREGKMEGIFTDGDLRRALQKSGGEVLHQPIKTLMTTRFRSIHPEALAWEAMQLMESDQKHPIMVLPVLESSGHVMGLIKMHDILQSGL